MSSPSLLETAQQRAEAELAEKPWLRVGECRCDAQYSAVSCSCLPGRLAYAKEESARMVAAAKAASERAMAERELHEDMASYRQKAQEELDNKPALKEVLEPCYCGAGSCLCLPGRVHRAKEKLKEKAAEAVGAGLEAAKNGESTPFLSLFRSRGPEPQGKRSTYDYTHHVETCPCGTCHKARVDSGTQGAYEKQCRENTRAALEGRSAECKATQQVTGRNICMECHVKQNQFDSNNRVKMPSQLDMMRQGYVLEEASWIATKHKREGSGLGAALDNACTAIANAAAKSGGVEKPEFARNLFTEMGTPADSKCPHGLPFYSCMPCSH